ncbi:MAG: threonine synthase [bacterium]|nr:threonine synthase [bacterium]
MLFSSTKNPSEKISLKQALLQGLAPDGGLYVPETIPQLEVRRFDELKVANYQQLCLELAKLWYGRDVPEDELERMTHLAYDQLEPKVVKLSGQLSALELFHGPTLSFKDFGARMLAQMINYFAGQEGKQYTILAATSGDTGVAIASAFSGMRNIRVVILYPKGKVSPFQESQMLSLQGNVQVYAVAGTFDDCQKNVKWAFVDPELKIINLTSANSINIGRLIPQSWYYIYACLQVLSTEPDTDLTVCVPSGNFGNLTACLLAKLQGARIGKILAATNINDIVPHYLKTGKFTPRPSQLTLANSMDIGNPSNWERVRYYLGEEVESARETLWGASKTDEQIRAAIRQAYRDYTYLLDPHGAIALQALLDYQQGHPGPGVAVMTGSPYKYRELLQNTIGEQFSDWPRLAVDAAAPEILEKDYPALKSALINKKPGFHVVRAEANRGEEPGLSKKFTAELRR